MKHRVQISGADYEVTGGRVRLNGAVHEIASGNVMINGAGYEIAFGGPLISFTLAIGATIYSFTAEEGMTWSEFISSKYNIGKDFHIVKRYVYFRDFGVVDSDMSEVFYTDKIIADEYYWV